MNKLTDEVAQEHLRDGVDNLKECVNTIRRVLKSFPELAEQLNGAVNAIDDARHRIGTAGSVLRKRS
jgi:hypothetical protein